MRAPAQPQQPVEWRSPKDLRGHRDAARVPSMTVVEGDALLADIAERGIQVPLDITANSVVLDGRHRHRVAVALGLDLVPVRIVEPPDEVEFMLLAALQRRQLSGSQRAALALELDEYRHRLDEAAGRKQANLKNSGVDVASMPHRAGRSRDHAARLAGVCPRLVQHAITVRGSDPVLYDQVKAGEIALGRAVKDIRLKARYAAIGESPPLPGGLFDLIYADPPWQMGGPSSSGSPEQHYPTMPTAEIAALRIPAADDAVLLMWAVTSLLPDALQVMQAWGFTYKSGLVWVKPSIGPGNYVRNRYELLLIATRGTYPTPLPKHRPDSVVEAPRGRHSEKPKCFYELIERMYPHATRLEMFARGKPRPGWTFWGNEVAQ
jgi:N6-adenosine-specific RNA methylase IME4